MNGLRVEGTRGDEVHVCVCNSFVLIVLITLFKQPCVSSYGHIVIL
jgi:hypothetical protein